MTITILTQFRISNVMCWCTYYLSSSSNRNHNLLTFFSYEFDIVACFQHISWLHMILFNKIKLQIINTDEQQIQQESKKLHLLITSAPRTKYKFPLYKHSIRCSEPTNKGPLNRAHIDIIKSYSYSHFKANTSAIYPPNVWYTNWTVEITQLQVRTAFKTVTHKPTRKPLMSAMALRAKLTHHDETKRDYTDYLQPNLFWKYLFKLLIKMDVQQSAMH
jgi:hypothetical protein